MERNVIKVKGVLLTGPEAIIIPVLATIGTAGVMWKVVQTAYKLGKKVREREIEKEREELEKELNEAFENFNKFMKDKEES
jgi:hypothetical protein